MGVLIVTWLGGGAAQPAIGLSCELSSCDHRARARGSLDPHATDIVAGYLAGAAR